MDDEGTAVIPELELLVPEGKATKLNRVTTKNMKS